MFRHNARLRKRRPSSPTVFGRGGETSSPPKMGGEERGLLLLPSRFWEGRSIGHAGRRAAPAPGVAAGRIISGEVTCNIFHLPSLFSGAERSAAACFRATSAGPIGGVPGCGNPPTPSAGASSTSAGLSRAPPGAGQWWSPDPRSRRAVATFFTSSPFSAGQSGVPPCAFARPRRAR